MWATDAVTPARLTFQRLPFSKPFKQPSTLRVSPLKIRLQACLMKTTLPKCNLNWICFILGQSTAKRRPSWLWLVKPPRSKPVDALPTVKVLACLHSRAISSVPTRTDFGAVMPVHVTACRWHPLHHCLVKMQKCNAMLGTPPCAQPIKWPRLKPWDGTPLSAR